MKKITLSKNLCVNEWIAETVINANNVKYLHLSFQINIWINPFIYGYMNRDFRRAFRILLRMKNIDNNSVAPTATENQQSLNTVSATVP